MSIYKLAELDLGNVSSATFLNINQNMNHLLLMISARSSNAVVDASLRITLNSDSSLNYPRLQRQVAKSQQTGYITGTNSTLSYFGDISIPGAAGLAGTYSHTMVNIFDYNDTTRYTFFNCESANEQNTVGQANYLAGMWKSNSPVRSITIFEAGSVNFVSGSKAFLYGYGA